MSVDANVWFVALLAAFCPASKGTSAKVEQFPQILKVSIGGSGSMYCKFPIVQDTAEVSWWKEGQKAFIKPNSRNQFNVQKGRGTFTLLNVSYTDVGRYYCQVKSQQQIFRNGSGSELIVLTPPTPLKIIRVEETLPKTLKLVCKTAPFYPKELDIFWRRNNMDILTKIETSITETSEGSFEASSTLEDTQPAQEKMVYTCLVSHETLTIPASFSYIVEQASRGTWAQMEQFPPTLKVPIGGNGSLYCIYPIIQDTAEVLWWKEGENTFIEPDSRNQFNVKKGIGIFTLLNLSYADVGRYYCQVKSQQQILGNGSGSQLIVLNKCLYSTPPTPLKIIRIEETSPKSRKLVCKTAPFYPKELDVFWRRNNMDIQTKIETVINETSEGSFEASSTLEDTQPAQGDVVYTCLVSHEALKIPASFSYIVEQDEENSNERLILGGALGGLAFLILIIVLIIIGVKARHVIQRTSEEASQNRELETAQDSRNKITEVCGHSSVH